MIDLPRVWRLPFRFLARGGLALALSGPLAGTTPALAAGSGFAQESPRGEAAAPAGYSLSLTEAINLALQRQPAVAAQRAGLASAQNASQAVESIRIPTLIARELPVRRQQAALGVTVAAAGLEQAEHDTVYAVTRTYYTAVYAREQERVARETVERLRATLESAERMVKAGSKDVTTVNVDTLTVYQNLAEVRRVQAAEGVGRALAALREAIGLGPDCCVDVPSGALPELNPQICREEIIALALARRGELVQSNLLAEITHLEVEAQGTSCRPKKETFAAAGDIHSRQVPQGVADGEYRPGAVPPEMPVMLAGSRANRMERARSLSARAAAVADKTRNLIALEAEDAYLRWQEASRKLPSTKLAATRGDTLAENLRRDFTAEQKVKVEDVISNQVLAAQARAQHNEALYQQILALAALERITAGGFCAGLTQAPVAPAAEAAPANISPASARSPNIRTVH
jgi:outer membrane protein TolC